MADIKWGGPGDWSNAVDAFASANFNALANNAGIISTAAPLDNSTNRHIWGRLSFICLTSTWAVSAGGHLAFYLLPGAHDGSSYPDSNNGSGDANIPGAHLWVASIAFRTATIAHIGVSKPFLIPPGISKFYVANRTGAALPSSGTNMTCKVETFAEAVS